MTARQPGKAALMGLGDAAEILGIGRATAYKWRAEGVFPIPVVRVGKLWMVNCEALNRFINASAGGTQAPEPGPAPPTPEVESAQEPEPALS